MSGPIDRLSYHVSSSAKAQPREPEESAHLGISGDFFLDCLEIWDWPSCSLLSLALIVWNRFQDPKSCLVRAQLGRPAAPPTATGWGEELLDRAVRHRPHGTGRCRTGRTGLLRDAINHPYVRSCSATGTVPAPAEPNRARIDWRT